MNVIQILQINNLLKALLDILYNDIDKKYLINIYWFENDITIIAKEQRKQGELLHMNFNGSIDDYQIIAKGIIELTINNNDTFGFLLNNSINNSKIHGIRTKNIEFELPIYNSSGLVYAENINNIILDNLNNNFQKKKTIQK